MTAVLAELSSRDELQNAREHLLLAMQAVACIGGDCKQKLLDLVSRLVPSKSRGLCVCLRAMACACLRSHARTHACAFRRLSSVTVARSATTAHLLQLWRAVDTSFAALLLQSGADAFPMLHFSEQQRLTEAQARVVDAAVVAGLPRSWMLRALREALTLGLEFEVGMGRESLSLTGYLYDLVDDWASKVCQDGTTAAVAERATPGPPDASLCDKGLEVLEGAGLQLKHAVAVWCRLANGLQ